jgi:transcriptional regulator with XRE-family HTH domain
VSFSLSIPAEILSILGARLRTQRLAQALSQRDLAKMAGLSLGALRKLEHDGQCSLDTLVRVVHALGLVEELEDLFVLKRQSIAQMEQAEAVSQRKRAPRRKAL